MKILVNTIGRYSAFYKALGVLFLLACLPSEKYHNLVDSLVSQVLVCIILPAIKLMSTASNLKVILK